MNPQHSIGNYLGPYINPKLQANLVGAQRGVAWWTLWKASGPALKGAGPKGSHRRLWTCWVLVKEFNLSYYNRDL